MLHIFLFKYQITDLRFLFSFKALYILYKFAHRHKNYKITIKINYIESYITLQMHEEKKLRPIICNLN